MISVLTPVGWLGIVADDRAVLEIRFGARSEDVSGNELTAWAQSEIEAYFAGTLRDFTVPAAPKGTEFQRKVWDAIREIPYGQTLSYGEIAAKIGHPSAARAVGMAAHRNPVPILIPCHRVVGRSGSLVGFSEGLETKRFLLDWESRGTFAFRAGDFFPPLDTLGRTE